MKNGFAVCVFFERVLDGVGLMKEECETSKKEDVV